MRDYPLDTQKLFEFSNSAPYLTQLKNNTIFKELIALKEQLNFPMVTNDVGALLSFLVSVHKPKVIFEMGSGFGGSAFWYSLNDYTFIDKIYLTEKRDDLQKHFNQISWQSEFKEKCVYHQGDAFEKLAQLDSIDFMLIDGVKGHYKEFLDKAKGRLSPGAIVVIDNSFWRGSFLDESITKTSAVKIRELHEYIKNSSDFQSIFLPFSDGVSILRLL